MTSGKDLMKMTSIFTWILIVAILAGPCQGKEEPKILILGAGMSGMTIAKTLDDQGFKNFLVIEGSSRIGGRMKSVNVSHHTVELGAMWVYGKGTNAVFKLLQEYNMSTVDKYPETMSIRDRFGNKVTDIAAQTQSHFEEVLEAITDYGKQARDLNLAELTMTSRLLYQNWLPKTEIDDAVEAFNIDLEFGVPPTYLSGKHTYIWSPYEEFGNDEAPILNDTRGYQSLVERLAHSYMTSEYDRIKFNNIVKNIKQDNDGVEVITTNKSRYHGDYVIVTFSVGVLQQKEVMFTPPLPKCKQIAFDKFGICPFTHIYLQFPSQFWDDDFYLVFASDQRARYNTFVNMDYIYPGSNILHLSVSSEEARRLERFDDETIVNDILKYIRIMYPNQAIPFPSYFAISRWTYDPLYHGAWSFWPTGFSMNNMADMQAPYGRIFFAGEHLDPKQYGFVHGSYASGLRTADVVIRCLENPEACPASIEQSFKCNKEELVTTCAADNLQSKRSGVNWWPYFSLVLIILLC